MVSRPSGGTRVSWPQEVLNDYLLSLDRTGRGLADADTESLPDLYENFTSLYKTWEERLNEGIA